MDLHGVSILQLALSAGFEPWKVTMTPEELQDLKNAASAVATAAPEKEVHRMSFLFLGLLRGLLQGFVYKLVFFCFLSKSKFMFLP